MGKSAIIGDDDFNAVKISANGLGTTYNTIGNGFIAPNVNFNINNQTKLTINGNSGNVGIGTTSPSAPLDVATISSGPVAKFVNTSGTGGAGVVIQAGVATSSSILTLFDYQNNERLRVRGDGNVGIGTTAPGYNLHIADTDATINLAKTDGDQYLRLVGGSGTNSDVIAQRTLTLQALSGNVLCCYSLQACLRRSIGISKRLALVLNFMYD